MAIRSDVHLVCTEKICEALKAAIEKSKHLISVEITAFTDVFYFHWDFVKWDRFCYEYCKDIYDVLALYENDPDESYKLIRFGESGCDVEIESSENSEEYFDWFVPIQTVQLPEY